MKATVIPKSDQLNFDDFISGQGRIIKITAVKINPSAEQKCVISYEGDNGKPYKPGKSMCRVLFSVWGEEENAYIGRSLMLYGDPTIKFGPDTVGGIRISHMSDIKQPMTIALAVSRGSRKAFTVQPLVLAAELTIDDWISDIEKSPTLEGLQHKFSEAQRLFKNSPDLPKLIAAKDKRKTQLTEGAP